MRLIDTRHEATAGHAAEAYARTTGRIGVCAVTAGLGFTNAYTSIANAYLDSVPVLFITSSPPLREAELNVLQGGFDQVAAAAPVTKWGHRVTHPERIPDLVSLAMRKAYSGRPGPVLLDVPIDVFFTPIDERLATRPTVFRVERPAPAPGVVRRALDVLRQAQRPALVLGGGTLFPLCHEEVLRFADRTGIPVFTTGKAHGMLPADHPCNCRGTAGLGILEATGMGADVVMLLGARQGMYTGGRGGMLIAQSAKLIQVDVEPSEIGRVLPVEVPIEAGCQETLRAMLLDPGPWPDWSEWAAKARGASAAMEMAFDPVPVRAPGGRLHPFHASKALFDFLGPDPIVTVDGGGVRCLGEHVLPLDRAGRHPCERLPRGAGRRLRFRDRRTDCPPQPARGAGRRRRSVRIPPAGAGYHGPAQPLRSSPLSTTTPSGECRGTARRGFSARARALSAG